jgi:hypothetical protein
MMTRLLSFLFLGILISLGYHLGFDLVYQRFFATQHAFVDYWYIFLILVPAALLLWLAWGVGFYRAGGNRGADALATLILAGLVFLTIPASYSCGLGCF